MIVPHRKHIYRPPRPVTVIALLIYIYIYIMFVPHRKYVSTSTACYGNIFTYIYTHKYVRISQETYIYTSKAYYGDKFTYIYMMFVPHRKHTYRPPRPVKG
jgi:hypothetical protein